MVSAAWLKENIDRVKLLDCSWYIPAMNRDGRAEHAASRLPGARYFDVDRVSDPSSPLPHMLPSEAQFAAACDALEIHNDDQVVVYGASGLFSAARGWWMFRVFGHRAVALLDGGAPAWLAAGGDIEDTPVDIQVVDAASAASVARVVVLHLLILPRDAEPVARALQGGRPFALRGIEGGTSGGRSSRAEMAGEGA